MSMTSNGRDGDEVTKPAPDNPTTSDASNYI
jgi:hypothetical protein